MPFCSTLTWCSRLSTKHKTSFAISYSSQYLTQALVTLLLQMLRTGSCCPAGECTENVRCKWKAWRSTPVRTDTPLPLAERAVKMKIRLPVLCVLRLPAAVIIPSSFSSLLFPINFRTWVCAMVLVVVALCKTTLKKWQEHGMERSIPASFCDSSRCYGNRWW